MNKEEMDHDKLPRCFECFKEHEIRKEGSGDSFDLMMFCSDQCAKEWNEMTKEWRI